MRQLIEALGKIKIHYMLIILLVVSATLSLLLSGIVRSVVLPPLLYILWIARIIYETLPQFFWWSLFLLIFFIIAMRAIARIGWRRSPTGIIETPKESRLETWIKWVDQTSRGEYFRWNLANEISKLTLNILASEERVSMGEIVYRIEQEEIKIPPEIQKYIDAGLNPQQSLQISPSTFWPFRRNRTTHLDLEIEDLIVFLEKRINLEK